MKHFNRKFAFATGLGIFFIFGLIWSQDDWENRWVFGLFCAGFLFGIGIYYWQLLKESAKRKDEQERRKLR